MSKKRFKYCCSKSLNFETYKNLKENKSFELGICSNCGNIKIITSTGSKLGKGAAVGYWEKYRDKSKKIELNEHMISKTAFPDFRYYDAAGTDIQNEFFLTSLEQTGRKFYFLSVIGKILFNILILKEPELKVYINQ